MKESKLREVTKLNIYKSLSISLLGTGTLVQVGGTSLLCCFHHICIRFVLVTLCCIVYLNTEKTGPLLLAWHHLNSDFQAFWNIAKYLVFFAAGALGDSICFGIFVVYQFHPGTWSLNITLIGFGPKQAITTQSEMNSLHV